MYLDPNIHHSKSPLLTGVDYLKSEMNYVTFWTNNLECIFGKIVDDKMVLNALGTYVLEEWLNDFAIVNYIIRDEFVIMPNHFHGFFLLDKPVFGYYNFPTIERIIYQFKLKITKKFNILQNTDGIKILQRNHLKVMIRDEKTHLTFSDHIIHNPTRWRTDNLYKK